jgi:integrase/recombinase XerC
VPTIEKMVKQFLISLALERNYSENTVKAYNNDLAQFQQFLRRQLGQPRVSLGEINRLAIRHFLGTLHLEGYNSRSIMRKLTAIRSFCRYLCRQGLLQSNPAAHLMPMRWEKRLPTFLDVAQAAKVMDLPDRETALGLRDWAILELLYGTGIRLMELVTLNRSALDLLGEVVKVRGKGKKERIVPIGGKAVEALRAYLTRRKELMAKGKRGSTEAVFLNYRGGRISGRSVRRIVNKYLHQVSEEEHLSPHLLRHTFATHMLDAGADLRAVKELLGHTSLSSTQIYTHVTVEKLRKVYDQAHPRA